MKRSLISVVMPVFNGEKYIHEAIESVLGQTYPYFELLIVNDNSFDATEKIIRSFDDKRIKYFKNRKRLGLAGNRNNALTKANGEFIAVMDADDISQPNRFKMQIQEFKKNENLCICGSYAEVIDENANLKGFWKFPTSNAALTAQMYVQFPFVHSSVMFRKNILSRLGNYYDKKFSPAEDYELCFRLMALGEIAVLPQYLIQYRLHDSNSSSKFLMTVEETLPKLLLREFQKLGLPITLEKSQSFVLFINPQSKKFSSVTDNLKLLYKLQSRIKEKYKISFLSLLQFYWYVCKLCILQMRNYFLGLVNQKQPQQ